jgi:hypothetical protein
MAIGRRIGGCFTELASGKVRVMLGTGATSPQSLSTVAFCSLLLIQRTRAQDSLAYGSTRSTFRGRAAARVLPVSGDFSDQFLPAQKDRRKSASGLIRSRRWRMRSCWARRRKRGSTQPISGGRRNLASSMAKCLTLMSEPEKLRTIASKQSRNAEADASARVTPAGPDLVRLASGTRSTSSPKRILIGYPRDSRCLRDADEHGTAPA